MAFLINYFNKIGKIRGDEWNLWSKSMYIFWTDNLSKSALEGTFGKRVNVNENRKSQEMIIYNVLYSMKTWPTWQVFFSWLEQTELSDFVSICWLTAWQLTVLVWCCLETKVSLCWMFWADWPDCWSSTEVHKRNIAAKISVCPCATLYIEYIMHFETAYNDIDIS